MNARTTAIARAQREALQAERRARLVQECQHTARTVRGLARRLGVAEKTIRRDVEALGPVLERRRPKGQLRGWLYRAVPTGLDDARYEAACDAALGGGCADAEVEPLPGYGYGMGRPPERMTDDEQAAVIRRLREAGE